MKSIAVGVALITAWTARMNWTPVATFATALVTAWMAWSTWRMAKGTKDMATASRDTIDLARESAEFSKGLERVRLLLSLLEVFETKVLKRPRALDDTDAHRYVGPTGPAGLGGDAFHHPDFLVREELRTGSGRTAEASAVDALNGIEQFAAGVEAGLRSKVWDDAMFEMLARPTIHTFVRMVNDSYDLLCRLRAESEAWYSSTVALYERWEPLVTSDAIENDEHLDLPHGIQRAFSHYRIGCDRDFADFSLPTEATSSPTEAIRSAMSGHQRYEWSWNGQEPQFVWVQAVGQIGSGIAGYPALIAVEGAKVQNVWSGTPSEPAAAESEGGYLLFGNSSGTVALELVPGTHAGSGNGHAAIVVSNPREAG